jgi:hypothetical protein
MQHTPAGGIEEHIGAIIVDGQRCAVWVRSEPDADGTWHNALVFRREARSPAGEALVTGVGWHLPPGIAAERAQELGDEERVALFRRALAPRPPLV